MAGQRATSCCCPCVEETDLDAPHTAALAALRGLPAIDHDELDGQILAGSSSNGIEARRAILFPV